MAKLGCPNDLTCEPLGVVAKWIGLPPAAKGYH